MLFLNNVAATEMTVICATKTHYRVKQKRPLPV